MACAGERVGVGLIASVAGEIAEFVVKARVRAEANHAIVDNGGDIAMVIGRPIIVGIYAGSSKTNNTRLKFQPLNTIIGVCTSSGTLGPSLSFGHADAATATDVFLADAAATALGNSIKEENEKQMEEVF